MLLLLLLLIARCGCISQCAFDSSVLLKDIDELTILVHLEENVTAADELSADVNLWDSWPTAEVFNSLAQLFVSQHIVRIVLDSMHSKDLNHSIGKATFRRIWDTLKDDKMIE